MDKLKLAIIGVEPMLEFALSLVDFDGVEVCAFFGEWEETPPSIQQMAKPVFYPLDEIATHAATCGADCFLLAIAEGAKINSVEVVDILREYGIDQNCIVEYSLFTTWGRINASYHRLWKYLKANRPKTDFFATGISYMMMGLDVPTMKHKFSRGGVNLSIQSQDLYYSYKMAECYLQSLANEEQRPKFCLIGLAPYIFPYQCPLGRADIRVKELLFLPYLEVNEREYSKIGVHKCYNVLFHANYKKFYQRVADKPIVNFNDFSNERSRTDTLRISLRDKLTVRRFMHKLGNKNYPQTVVFNKKIMSSYLQMLNKCNIIPVGVLWPFSELGRKHYPQDKLTEFYSTLTKFLDKMYVADLWNLRLSDDCFYDLEHLNIKGSRIATAALADALQKIIPA